MSSAKQLTPPLLSSRSGAAPWSRDSWLLSEATVKQRARRLLDTQGDRGWGEHPTRLPTAEYWVAHRRQAWPGRLHLCIGPRSA